MRTRKLLRTTGIATALAATGVGAVAAAGIGHAATARTRQPAVATGPADAADRARHPHPTGSATWPWNLVDPAPDLVRPQALTVDRSVGESRARLEVRLAQQLYTFWNTGDLRYLDAAVSPAFRDNTLPAGRPQGPSGPAFASKSFRAAVPDLTCELADVLISGDKITARLVFRGHFTGTFDGVPGTGQTVEFNAIDIQHVGTDQIVEDWHIEDNQTLLGQLGITGGADAAGAK